MMTLSRAHVFTVDLEEYFQVESFADVVPRDAWDTYPSRVEWATRMLLDLLDGAGATATFFVLGWVAIRHRALIREIAARGHEVACHSFWHRLAYRLTRTEFAADALRAKTVLEQIIGRAVHGYRAPSFSITRHSLWALDVLAECGFAYDASIFPIRHDIYGIPEGPRRPFHVGALSVCPMTTFRWIGRHNWPVGGGGYLRLLPWWYTELGMRRRRRKACRSWATCTPGSWTPRSRGFRGVFGRSFDTTPTCTRLGRASLGCSPSAASPASATAACSTPGRRLWWMPTGPREAQAE
jgi:polysaccharide deacetylase family protein (PEP-CTERM system associated)